MGTILEGPVAQTETDLRAAVRLFHPGERHLVRFAVGAGIPDLDRLGDLVAEGQLTLIEPSGSLKKMRGAGSWRELRARTRLIRINPSFNWETFTKSFIDTRLIEHIEPYEK